VAPEESIKTVQMILTPSQGRPLPSVHLESVSPGLLLLPSNVRPVTCPALPRPGRGIDNSHACLAADCSVHH